MWEDFVMARRMKRIKAAVSVVEGAGLAVCNIQQRGGSYYLVDRDGQFHRISRR
jgi:hypothetical protein